MRTLLTILGAIMFSLLANPAHADLKACNNSTETIWVAITNYAQPAGHIQPVISSGWVAIGAGNCAAVWNGKLEPSSEALYYALVRDSQGYWGGITDRLNNNAGVETRPFCVKDNEDFQYLEDVGLNSLANCQRRDYFRVNTGDQADATIGLNP